MARKLNKNLLALGSAAIVSVYAVGLAHTAGSSASTSAASAAQSGAVTQTAPTTMARAIASATATAPPASTSNSVVPPGRSREREQEHEGGAFSSGGGPVNVAPSPTATATAPAASQSVPAQGVPAQSAGTKYKDGTYTGSGTSRLGDVSVAVTIQGGQISDVRITGGTTHYPLSRISRLPGEVVSAQGTNIQLVSGATYSSQAFKQAVTQALTQAANGA